MNSIVPGSLAAIAQANHASLAESFLSAEVLLLVDMSGSMCAGDAPGNRTRYDAAEEELRELQAAHPGKVAVVAFSDSAQFCPGGVPPRLGGMTDMARALEFVQPSDGVARIVLISDGYPDEPTHTLEVARRFKHKIDTVYIGPEKDARGRQFLRDLAAATGGSSLASAAPAMLGAPVTALLEAAA